MADDTIRVLGTGFACIDIIRNQDRETVMLGGTAANVISLLSLFGQEAQFLIAHYSGKSGEYIERALNDSGVGCVFYLTTKSQAPRVIERIGDGNHSFITTCPACGRSLASCKLPSLAQIDKALCQYVGFPNVFFFDRMSGGIMECARRNKMGWNVYEPNACRSYSNLINGIRIANIVKFSEDRLSSVISNNIIKDIEETDVILVIATMGADGLKYAYRNEMGLFGEWKYMTAFPIEDVVDCSGSGDWLTAVFLYMFLKKYPVFTKHIDAESINKCLMVAQYYAAQNCRYIGAQGMLQDREMIKQINDGLDADMHVVGTLELDWNYNCEVCYSEN